MCTDGTGCKRRVCFFAHTENELRKPEEDPAWLQQQLQVGLRPLEGFDRVEEGLRRRLEGSVGL
jgi:hypothetical protein